MKNDAAESVSAVAEKTLGGKRIMNKKGKASRKGKGFILMQKEQTENAPRWKNRSFQIKSRNFTEGGKEFLKMVNFKGLRECQHSAQLLLQKGGQKVANTGLTCKKCLTFGKLKVD